MKHLLLFVRDAFTNLVKGIEVSNKHPEVIPVERKMCDGN